MRFSRSASDAYEAFKTCARARVRGSGNATSRAGRSGAACMESLEARQLLAAANPAQIKIPVFNFHSVLDTVVPDSTGDSIDVTSANFRRMMQHLADNHFFSVKLQSYLDWRNNGGGLWVEDGNGGHILQQGERAFIATFDDANHSDRHKAAGIMAGHDFVGVSAVTTGFVNKPRLNDDGTVDTAHGGRFMYWSEVRELAYDYNWDVVSHSKNHRRQVKPNGSNNYAAGYRNSPSELVVEISGSKADIEANVFDDVDNDGVKDTAEDSLTPLAFIHPFHDVTMRSLRVASEAGYPLVFGQAGQSFIGMGPNTADLQSGQLLRFAVSHAWTISDTFNPATSTFDKVLADAMATSTFSVPAQPAYPSAYIATDGTVVVDGRAARDIIKLDASYLDVNGTKYFATTNRSDPTLGKLAPGGYTYSPPNTRPNPNGVTAWNVNGNGGDDLLSLAMVVPSTINAGSGNDVINGGGGADRIYGDSGNDSIYAGAGDDILDGGLGADSLHGQLGKDTVDYTAKASSVRVTIGNQGGDDGTVINNISEGDNVQNDIEQVWGSGWNDVLDARAVSYGITLDGAKGKDTLYGGSGHDVLIGGVGTQTETDSLHGGAGNDTLYGGGGDDWLWGETGVDWFDGGPGTDQSDWVSGETKFNVP